MYLYFDHKIAQHGHLYVKFSASSTLWFSPKCSKTSSKTKQMSSIVFIRRFIIAIVKKGGVLVFLFP